MAYHPEVLWAQRSSEVDEKKNIVYLTVNLPDIKPETLEYNLTPSSISFKAKAGNAAKGLEERDYEFKLDLFAEIIPEESVKALTSRHLAVILRKKEKKAEFWPRLTKEKIKTMFVKTDFSKWVDEDEQDGEAPAVDEDDMGGMGGMGGMPGMGGMGGMPGMGGMGGMPGMGGMGGMGGMDFEQMMKSMGGGAGGLGDLGEGPSGAGDDDDDDDDDDDGPPPLEEAEPAKTS